MGYLIAIMSMMQFSKRMVVVSLILSCDFVTAEVRLGFDVCSFHDKEKEIRLIRVKKYI